VTPQPLSALAFAKVNLALVVYHSAADGYHPIQGLFQSVSLSDTVRIVPSTDDRVFVSNDEAPADEHNVAWVALDRMRHLARIPMAMELHLEKRIPAGAGLGGGSADAGAVVGLFSDTYDVDAEDSKAVAASIGSDVPFALEGGTAVVRGRGEVIEPVRTLEGFAIALVVPPFSLETPEVFRMWDELGGPHGRALSDGSLPPELRGREPIRNDLYPAAVALDPRIADWADQLSTAWGTEVSMTGSGSALFAYFADRAEADAAADSVSIPARLSTGVSLVDRGWERIHA
jgi:4-diphosphocytidyl-2-C-methyl-D-erythritol kinase